MEDDKAFLARIDETITAAVQAFFEGKAEHELNLSDLQLRIRLSGPSWAGVVDRPVAKFLVDLDAMLIDEFRSLGLPVPETNHGLVALQIQEGSLDAFLQYSKDVFEGFRKLKPAQQILVVGTVLTAIGIYKSDDIINALQAPQVAQIEAQKDAVQSKERVELVQAVGRISEDQRRLQTPMRGLVSKMSDTDQIDLPGQAKPLKKDEAKNQFAKSTRSSSEIFYIDHPYKVDDLLTKDPENWQIGLSFGDYAFRAKLRVTAEEVEKLMKDFQEAHARGSAIAPEMHVTAKVSAKGVRDAEVVGLGPARQKAVKLSEALEAAKQGRDEEEASSN